MSEKTASSDSYAQLDWTKLPVGLTRIRDVAGPEAALALCSTYGGGSVYIPRRLEPGHPLLRLLGAESAARLASYYGGDKLDVPKADAVHRQHRAVEIMRQRSAGASISGLAALHGLSRRRILQILAENQGDPS